MDAVSDALYDMEGITKGVSTRTVQSDIQMMRSDKMGYNAPIIVYDNKYYKYEDPNYSISDSPVSTEDYKLMTQAIRLIENHNNEQLGELDRILTKVKDRLTVILSCG